MGKLQDYVRECIIGCKSRAEINTQNKAEVLLDKFAQRLDEEGGSIPTVQVGGDTLTWDGNTEGRLIVDASAMGASMLVQLSDAIVTADDLSSEAYVKIDSVDGEFLFPFDRVVEIDAGIIGIAFGVAVLISVFPDAVGVEKQGVVFPKSGLYVQYEEDGVETNITITIPGYTGFGEKKIDPAYLYQPDWNQNDETAPGFIKNRPFYTSHIKTEIAPETEIVGNAGETEGTYFTDTAPAWNVSGYDSFEVVFDGATYKCGAIIDDSQGIRQIMFGNLSMMGTGDDTGEPFVIGVIPDMGMSVMGWFGSSTCRISIVGVNVLNVPVPDEYIPKKVVSISSAEVGQTVKVTEIDENGVPIAWEAVDIPVVKPSITILNRDSLGRFFRDGEKVLLSSLISEGGNYIVNDAGLGWIVFVTKHYMEGELGRMEAMTSDFSQRKQYIILYEELEDGYSTRVTYYDVTYQ